MPERTARRAVAFSNIGHFQAHMFMLLYPTIVLVLEPQFNLPYGELLPLALPGFILFGAGALPAGWLGDRWSESGMLAAMFFGLGASALLAGLAPSPLWIGVGLAGIGLSGSIYHPVGVSMIVRVAERRGRALGFNGVFGSLGVASAGILAGGLSDAFGWRAAFLVPGALALATGALYVALGAGRGPNAAAPPRRQAAPEFSRRDLVGSFLVLGVATAGSGLIFNATSVALPKVFAQRMDVLGGATLSVGGLVSLVYLFGGGAQLLGGYLSDRFSLRRLYLLSYVLQAPLLVLAALLSHVPLLAAVVGMVVLQLAAVPVESSLYARYSAARWQGTAFGAKFVISLGVSALAVPLVAVIHERTGAFFWLFAILGGLAVVVACAALLLPREDPAAPRLGATREAAPAAGG